MKDKILSALSERCSSASSRNRYSLSLLQGLLFLCTCLFDMGSRQGGALLSTLHDYWRSSSSWFTVKRGHVVQKNRVRMKKNRLTPGKYTIAKINFSPQMFVNTRRNGFLVFTSPGKSRKRISISSELAREGAAVQRMEWEEGETRKEEPLLLQAEARNRQRQSTSGWQVETSASHKFRRAVPK